ncbi:MAG: preprotein translocase subunit SecG [Verrucomicrobiota bacterium]|jgi:preprotein translocase subunit SecG
MTFAVMTSSLFFALNWLSISINLLLVVFVIVCLLMGLLVLMQRPKQEGLGAAFGGGVTDQVFGARTTNVLQKGTVFLGSLFFLLSIVLAILIGKQNKSQPIIETKNAAAEVSKSAPPAPITPPAPPSSLITELPATEPPATGTPETAVETTPQDVAQPAPQTPPTE